MAAAVLLGFLVGAAQAEIWTCSGNSSCGGCEASGNVSVTCSSSASGASCTSVNQEGGTTTTTTVVIKCREQNLMP